MTLPFRVPHERPLLRGTLLGREKRFLAYVRLRGGERVVAHSVNPGAMEGLVRPGSPVWLSPAPEGSARKLAYTLELIEIDGVVIGANTAVANRVVKRLLEARQLRGFSRYTALQAERAYGERSRIDFWLEQGGEQHFVEVKNCHLVYPDRRGYFPDAKSERAARHLHELSRLAAAGHRATVLFTVQHPLARSLRPSDVHDPAMADAARRAARAGVRFRALRVVPSPSAYLVERFVPVDLRPYALSRIERWRAANRPYSGSRP